MEEPLLPPRAIDRFMVKVRHIMPTLVYILAGSVSLTMLLGWVSIEHNVFNLKEDIWNFWIPIALPWIPMTIWLRPKLRILTAKKDASRLSFGFQFLAWFAIGIPCLIGQAYIKSATGTLTEINNFEEIGQQPDSRYYAIKNFEVDSAWTALGEDIRTSGKYNETLNIDFYFVQPLVSDVAPFDSTRDLVFWYGIKFHESISNRDSDAEKERKYEKFYEKCIRDVRFYHFKDVTYFEKALPSDDLDGFLKGIERISLGLKGRSVVLEPVREPFESRTGNKLAWVFGASLIGLVVFTIFLSFVRYSLVELDKQKEKIKPESDEIMDMFRYLIPKDTHFMTSIILDINIVVMIVMIFSGVHILYPNGMELMEWGALKRSNVDDGELWRLVTSMFVHAGIAHLMFNIYGLIIASSFLEGAIKRTRYTIIYFASGIAGGIATIFWTASPAVGASGAIFGLFGAVLGSLLTGFYSNDLRKGLLQMFGPYVAINLLIGFFLPGIGNAAHIGGLVTGFVLGLLFFRGKGASEMED